MQAARSASPDGVVFLEAGLDCVRAGGAVTVCPSRYAHNAAHERGSASTVVYWHLPLAIIGRCRLAQRVGHDESLPAGVEMVATYDCGQLIDRAVESLTHNPAEEFIMVVVVCALFLWRLRSSRDAIASVPLGVLIAFVLMRHHGINIKIMSLGGIAIAVGAMVDAPVVMIAEVEALGEGPVGASNGKGFLN